MRLICKLGADALELSENYNDCLLASDKPAAIGLAWVGVILIAIAAATVVIGTIAFALHSVNSSAWVPDVAVTLSTFVYGPVSAAAIWLWRSMEESGLAKADYNVRDAFILPPQESAVGFLRVFGAALTVLLALAFTQAGVAAECIYTNAHESCTVANGGFFKYGETWYETTTELHFLANDQTEESIYADVATWHESTYCSSITPNLQQGPTSLLAYSAPVTRDATAYVHGLDCSGWGVGAAIGYIVSAVGVYVQTHCPGEVTPVAVRDVTAQVYIDPSVATYYAGLAGVGHVRVPTLKVGFQRYPFPVSGLSWGPLYINADGSVVESVTPTTRVVVLPPTEPSSTTTTLHCREDDCKHLIKGNLGTCPGFDLLLPSGWPFSLTDVVTGKRIPGWLQGGEVSWNTGFLDAFQEHGAENAAYCVDSGSVPSAPGFSGAGTMFLRNFTVPSSAVFNCVPVMQASLAGCLPDSEEYGPSTEQYPGGTGSAPVRCVAAMGAPYRFYGIDVAPPQPFQGSCAVEKLGLLNCSHCSDYTWWCNGGGAPPMSHAGGAQEVVNGTWISGGGAAEDSFLCKLEVLGATADAITVRALNPPCTTIGDWGYREFTTPASFTFLVPLVGTACQTIANGSACWNFSWHYNGPGKRHNNGSSNVYPGPPQGDDTWGACHDCSCQAWDCFPLDLGCILAHAASWRSAKCAFCRHPIQSASTATWVEAVAFRIAVTSIGLVLIVGIATACYRLWKRCRASKRRYAIN